MDEPWTIRPYRNGDEHAILGLFNAVFAAGNPDFVPRTLRHWQWEFRDNPLGHQTFLAEAGGEVVGQYTAVPCRWRFPHGVALGAQALDSCVAAGHRQTLKKAGVFLTLARAWFDHFGRPERDNIVYGFPNPQAFRIGTRRLDYRPVHCPLPELALPAAAAGTLPLTGVEVAEVADFGAEVDDLDAALAPALGIAAVRDATYLRWRYRACPTTSYRVLRAASAAGLRGYLVFGLGWHGFRKDIAPLVDWLVAPGDREALAALVRAAAMAATAAGLRELLAWAPPHHAHFQDLLALGFQPAAAPFNLCIRIFCDSFTVADAVQRWYVLMGDSDIY